MAVGNEAFFLKRVKNTEKVISEKQRHLKTWKERLEKVIAEKQQQLKTWKERLEKKSAKLKEVYEKEKAAYDAAN